MLPDNCRPWDVALGKERQRKDGGPFYALPWDTAAPAGPAPWDVAGKNGGRPPRIPPRQLPALGKQD